MIDCKDVVVGSYVQDEDGELLIVTETHSVVIQCEGVPLPPFSVAAYYSHEDLVPVPITPEWLERLGYSPTPFFNGTIYLRDSIHAHIKPFYRNGIAEWRLILGRENIDISSVHRLQALVWNLERIWLTLTPETL